METKILNPGPFEDLAKNILDLSILNPSGPLLIHTPVLLRSFVDIPAVSFKSTRPIPSLNIFATSTASQYASYIWFLGAPL